MFIFFTDKKSFLNKRDIYSLYKIVNFLQNELRDVEIFDEVLLDYKFSTYDSSFSIMYYRLEGMLRDNPEDTLKISFKVNNEDKVDRYITDLAVLANGKVPIRNTYLISILNLLPSVLEYYTNKYYSNPKIVNSNTLYLYIVNVLEIYINIYLLKKE